MTQPSATKEGREERRKERRLSERKEAWEGRVEGRRKIEKKQKWKRLDENKAIVKEIKSVFEVIKK